MSLQNRKRHQTKVLLDTIDNLANENTLLRDALHVALLRMDEGDVGLARLVLAGVKAQSKLMEGRK